VAQLSDGDRRHLEQVLRLPVGDTCEIVWEGRVFRARVRSDGCELIEEVEALPKAPLVTVWIAQPGARSDEAVEKLTELGVARIGPLRTELLKGAFSESRLDRWARVAEAAAKQSKQSRVPSCWRRRPTRTCSAARRWCSATRARRAVSPTASSAAARQRC
jgi:RsmE family RNA methyltransferase